MGWSQMTSNWHFLQNRVWCLNFETIHRISNHCESGLDKETVLNTFQTFDQWRNRLWHLRSCACVERVSVLLALPGCNGSRSKPDLSSHNDGVPGRVSRTWHRQNAANIQTHAAFSYKDQIYTRDQRDVRFYKHDLHLVLTQTYRKRIVLSHV